jgi:ABC-type transport system substrate-binding protein
MTRGLFEIKNYLVVFIEGSDAAITALKTGEVDVLDSQYHLEAKLDSIEEPWGDWVAYDAFGVQELGFNMKHPIFGTGVDTPLGQQDPSKAAEAARYVRQAISHLIPRQSIIDTILDGYGTPAITTPITTLTAGYDTSLKPYSYDIQMAKSLLAAAGYDTGVAPPSKGFLQDYGLYVAIAIVVVVVAVGAVYFVRRRRK